MPDVLQADALRKLKKQRQGEEDPVIVAQRFLNIYRQLHIFSEDKRIAFNKMLLELKPEIRAVLTTIPGGIVIQDYIEELEEKEGIAPHSEDSTPDSAANSPQILAAALADAQTTPQPQAQQAPIPSVIQQVPVSSKLEIGKDFAKELAQALSASFSNPPQVQASAPSQIQMDISPLISSVEQGQKEIINILRSETLDRKNESQNMTKMLLASQHQLAAALQKKDKKPADNNYIEAFKSLAENQKQLAQMISTMESNNKNSKQDLLDFFETSQQRFQQTIQNISSSQQSDTKALVEALGNSHKELAQILHQNNTQQNQQTVSTAANQNANNIQINSADYSGQLALIAERLGNLQTTPSASFEKAIEQMVTAQSRIYQETLSAQTKELGAIIKLALKESQEASTEALLLALEKLPKPEVRIAEPIHYAPPPTYPQTTAWENDTPTMPEPEPQAWHQEEALPVQEIVTEPIVDEIANDVFADEAKAEAEAPKKKKKKKKKKNKTAEADVPPQEAFSSEENPFSEFDDLTVTNLDTQDVFSPESEQEESVFSFEPELLPEVAPEESSPFFEQEVLPETKTEEDVFSFEPETLPEIDNKELNPFAGKSDIFQIKMEEPVENFETSLPPEKITTETDAAFDWGFNNTENTVEEPAASPIGASWNGDDDFVSLSETSSTEETNISEEQQDWEWEYVEETDDNAEWEWEYVEDNGGDETNVSSPIAQNAPIYHEDSLSQNLTKTSQKFVPADVIDIGNRKIAIKDSKNTDTQDDPYQNNNLKH